jgi:hypothetical protein
LSYDKFIFALGGAGNPKGLAVYDKEGALGAKETALRTYTHYTTAGDQTGDAKTGDAKVKNFDAEKAVKDAFEWTQCIKKVGEV